MKKIPILLSLIFIISGLFLISIHGRKTDNNGFYINVNYGMHSVTKTSYSLDGFDITGYNKEGFNKSGYNKMGYSKNGYNKEGYDKNGFNTKGYNKNGYNQKGFTKQGYNDKGYNIFGYDKTGADKNGMNKEGQVIHGTFTAFFTQGQYSEKITVNYRGGRVIFLDIYLPDQFLSESKRILLNSNGLIITKKDNLGEFYTIDFKQKFIVYNSSMGIRTYMSK